MKLAAVTGSTRGFGAAIADALYVSGFNVARYNRELLKSDIENCDEIEADVLVNCAGEIGPIGPFVTTPWFRWVETFNTDFLLAARLCKMVLPGMIRRRYGKIINISGGGATKALENFSAYSAAKTALVRFTETLAEEVRPFNIDVNAVAPGAMYSRITETIIGAGPERAGEKMYSEAVQVKEENRKPDRAVELCVFLSSPNSDGITGKLISALHDPWESFCEVKQLIIDSDIYTLRRLS
jgi:3-oxoacyl-[acyl-carrier protein] reductase